MRANTTIQVSLRRKCDHRTAPWPVTLSDAEQAIHAVRTPDGLQHHAGEVPPPIRVDGDVIVDGNHRYVAGRLVGTGERGQPIASLVRFFGKKQTMLAMG